MLIRIDYLMSTQTDKVRQKKCPECKKRIDLPNYDVHLQKCIETRSQLSSNSSMSNVSLQNGERTKGKRKYVEKVEYFPCHLCGFNQTMMDLDTHPRICPNKEINCPQCHLNFPSNILPAHK